MIVVLPDTVDGLADVSARLGAQELPQLFAALRSAGASTLVNVVMPRFKASLKPSWSSRSWRRAWFAHSTRRRRISAA
jgi:hypothetical protein